MPLTLFPNLSKGGDHRQIPATLGITSRMMPDTPDLAGSPTYRRNVQYTVTKSSSMIHFSCNRFKHAGVVRKLV